MSITPEPTPSNERVPSTPPTSPPPAPKPPGNSSFLGLFLMFFLPGLLICGCIVGFFYFTEYRGVVPVNFVKTIRTGVVNPEKLDDKFTDSDGDLLADTPKDEKQLLDPEILNFSTLEIKHDKAKAEWKEFVEHLAKVTGKKVELVETPTGGVGIVNQMKEGKLHLATLSTGTVPLAVNTAGFIPCFVMGDENGNWAYQMEILVPSSSSVKTLKDLRGKTLTLSSMSSLSGFKAPIVTLWKEFSLLPDVDYSVRVASGQRAGIVSVCEGASEAVAVANDYLARVVRDNNLDPKRYVSIYKSKSYPPFCMGHVYNLKPELAAKIKKAFETFSWKGTALEKAYKPSNQSKFVAIDYKKDFASVREVDAAILELVEHATTK